MSFRTILTYLADDEWAEARLQVAKDLAERFEAELVVRPASATVG